MADDFSKGPGNGSKFSRPVRYFVRPPEPGRFVRLPFGGHAETERVRRFDGRRRFHWTKEFNTEVAELAENTEKRKNTKSAAITENIASKDSTGKSTLFVAEPAVEDR